MLDSHTFLPLCRLYRRDDSRAVGQTGGHCGKHNTGFVRVLIEPQIGTD